MSQKKFISLDLELEQPKTNPQTPDSVLSKATIIQVGWVVFSINEDVTTTDDLITVHERKSHFVNIGVPLSAFIKKLTGIRDSDLVSGLGLVDAYQDLVADLKRYNASRIVRQWGGGDMSYLKVELETETILSDLERIGYKWEFGHSGFNVKHLHQAHCVANDVRHNGGLAKSMRKHGLKWVGGKAHNATIDALNTALIYAHLQNKLKDN
jgi:hypothetical protein